MSDPTLSDIDFKNKMAWVRTTLRALRSFKVSQGQTWVTFVSR